MVIQRPFDTIEKVESVFASVRREADATGGSRMTAKSFRDRLLAQVKDIRPEEQAATERWFCSKIRG